MIILDASALYPLAKLSRGKEEFIANILVEEKTAILDLTLYETANAAVIEARRKLINDPLRLVKAVSTLIEYLTVIRINQNDLIPISTLARETGLTVYDAAYVYYAKKHGAKLITCDKEIITKANDIALDLKEWLKNINDTKH